MIVSLLLLVFTMAPFFMVFEKRKPRAREIVLIAMMLFTSNDKIKLFMAKYSPANLVKKQAAAKNAQKEEK